LNKKQLSDFELSESRQGDDVRLEVAGKVDVFTSPQLLRAISRCAKSGIRSLHIALDGVPRMDSSGIATLVEGLKWSRNSGGSFTLSGLQEPVRELIVLSKLDGEFELAVESVGPGRQK